MLKVEPTKQTGGICACCGHETSTVWGLVRQEDAPIASYIVQWTVGQSLASHPANIDLIYGSWGEGSQNSDRSAISLVHFENENGPGITVVDANDRPVAKNGIAGHALRREDVLGTPLADTVFQIIDAVLLQDDRLS